LQGGTLGGNKRPNILFITADDMSFDSLVCTGCKLPGISPNLTGWLMRGC
jgi:arylsulfatase A-like enzyme